MSQYMKKEKRQEYRKLAEQAGHSLCIFCSCAGGFKPKNAPCWFFHIPDGKDFLKPGEDCWCFHFSPKKFSKVEHTFKANQIGGGTIGT